MNRFEEEINKKLEIISKEFGIEGNPDNKEIFSKLWDLVNISFNYGAYKNALVVSEAILNNAKHLEDVSCNNSPESTFSALDDSPENFNE